jgi:cyanophycin synthetase
MKTASNYIRYFKNKVRRVNKYARQIFVMPVRRARRRDIPVAMITGSKGKTTTSLMLAHILACANYKVGVTTTDGVTIDGKVVLKQDSAGYKQHRLVLKDDSINAAVLETARGGLQMRGLYIDVCNVAALLNVGREHLETDGIDTVEQMAELKRKVIDAAQDRIVLNADDRLCREMIADYPVEKTVIFSLDRTNDAVARHVEAGGTAFCLDDNGCGNIVRINCNQEKQLLSVENLPSANGGLLRHNVANAMAAAALAEGMGVDHLTIASALQTFGVSSDQLPGRFNMIKGFPFELILDRASGPLAAQELVQSLDRMQIKGRKLCMLTAGGNRSSDHYDEFCYVLANKFDYYVIYEEKKYMRKRCEGEIANFLKDGLLKNQVRQEDISVASNFHGGLAQIVQLANPEDIVMVLGGELRTEFAIREIIERHIAA